MQALLTRQPTLASLGIRARLLDAWSHSMGVLNPTTILDSTALHDGVRERPLSEALAPATSVLSLHIPLPDEASGLAWALDRKGTPYDWPAIWGFFVGDPSRDDPKRLYCHQYIAGWCRAGGLTDFDPLRLVKAKHLIRVAARIGQVRELRPTVSWG